MSEITKEFLNGIGVHMDDQTFTAFNEHFSDTLHSRIIDAIVKSLDQAHMQEFTQLQATGNTDTWEWLQTNVPNLNEMVRDQVNALLSELVQNSDDLA